MLLCNAAIVACRLRVESSNVMLCVRVAGIAIQLLDEELKLNLVLNRRSSSPLLQHCSTSDIIVVCDLCREPMPALVCQEPLQIHIPHTSC